jgi:plasmid stabilization system protein ParE
MAYKLKIKDEAEQDIIDGFSFYVRKGSNLGERFVNEVEDVFDYIENYPEHFQVVYNEHRQRLLKSFPYVVIYKIIGNEVIVFSVFPAKSNPAKKPK